MPRRLAGSRWLGLAIGAVVLLAWGGFVAQRLDDLRQYPWDIAPAALVAGIVAAAVYFGGLALCWALLLRRVANSPVSRGGAMRAWLYSMTTRYIPGNVWHILSRVAFAQRLGVSKTQVLTSASIEQVLTLLAMLLLFACALPFWAVSLVDQVWFLLLVPLGLVALHPQVLGRLLIWAAARCDRPELAWHYTYRTLLLLLVAYIGASLWAGLSLYVLLLGLAPTQLADAPLIIGAAGLAWAVGYLSLLTPSGLGVREAVLVAALSSIYPLPVAIIGSLLYRLVMTLGELGAVGVAWSLERYHTAETTQGT